MSHPDDAATVPIRMTFCPACQTFYVPLTDPCIMEGPGGPETTCGAETQTVTVPFLVSGLDHLIDQVAHCGGSILGNPDPAGHAVDLAATILQTAAPA